MVEDKLLTVREVAVILGISEKEVLDLAQNSQMPAYKIGGMYVRFKREHVEQYRSQSQSVAQNKKRAILDYPVKDRFLDFFYFNDFYLAAFIVIGLIIFLIFRPV